MGRRRSSNGALTVRSACILSTCGLLHLCPSAQAFASLGLSCGSQRLPRHHFENSVSSHLSTSSLSRSFQELSWSERQDGCGEAHSRWGSNLKPTMTRRRPRIAMVANLGEDIDKCSLVVVGSNRGFPEFLGFVVKKESEDRKVLLHVRKSKESPTTIITPRQVRFVFPGGSAYTEDDLQAIKIDMEHLRKKKDLVDVWEGLLRKEDYERERDIKWFSGELYGSPDPLQCYSTFKMLTRGGGVVRFFRNKKGLYEPRSRVEAETLLMGQSAQGMQGGEAADLITRIKADLKKGGGYLKEPLVQSDFTPIQQEILKALKHFAAKERLQFDADSNDPKDKLSKQVLAMLDRNPTSSNAFSLCFQLGLVSKHENLYVIGAGLEKEFPEEIIAAARELIEKPPADMDADSRLDLRHLKTFTIDREDAKEVDDGLSLERMEGGQERVWIHIADVSRWVREGGHLYREAKRRMTAIYLPEEYFPMFPPELGAEVISLRPGKVSYALSMGITLGESGDIVNYTIVPTLVEIDQCMTYDDAEKILASSFADDEGWELGRLSQLATTRSKYRAQMGSLDRYGMLPVSTIKVTENPQSEEGVDISISPNVPDSASQLLVSEMMILGGEVMGRLATQKDIPMPFRSQKARLQPPSEAFLDSFPEKYCRTQVAFTKMSPAITTIVPGEHVGMGLKSYVQWTSPLRRYMDLLVHYQIKHMLRGEEAIDPGRVLTEVVDGEGVLQAAQSVVRETEKYWSSVYLSRQIGREMEAYVLKRRDVRKPNSAVRNMYTLFLPGLGLTVPLSEDDEELQLGETVIAKVESSFGRRGKDVRVSWRRPSQEERKDMGD